MLGNANKFTFKGYIRLGVKLKPIVYNNQQSMGGLAYNERQVKVKFEVEDTGVGIKEEDLEKLFKLFGKMNIKNHVNQNGIGLGTSISKKLVEALGGNIKVKSEVNKGTIFKFHIVALLRD